MPLSELHIKIDIPEGKKIYFAGDFHLGYPTHASSIKRELEIVSWLGEIKNDAAALFLMGDQFDFWFEYKYVVPKGYIRFLAKLIELKQAGIQLFMFRGNHDMWTNSYWADELDATVISDFCILSSNNKTLMLHHGDGLGNGEKGYKMLRRLFRAPWSSWLFARLHPNLGFFIATKWSRGSRKAQGNKYREFLGEEKEILLRYAKEKAASTTYDFFVFGHRHLAMERQLDSNKIYVNTGTWLHGCPYAEFDGESISLKEFSR